MYKNIVLYILLSLLLLFFAYLVFTGFFLSDTPINRPNSPIELIDSSNTITHDILYSFAIVSDSHVNYSALESAINMTKNVQDEYKIRFIIHLGDLSDLGTLQELTQSKAILDSASVPYYVLPGDRDIFDNSQEELYSESTIFYDLYSGRICKDQLLSEYKVSCLINPYNYTLIPTETLEFTLKDINNSNIVLTSQPLYNPSTNLYMGFFSDDVLAQAKQVLDVLHQSGVVAVISGDAHFFSFYTDPSYPTTTYYTAGALTDQRNIQKPNFLIVSVFEDYTLKVNKFDIN